MDHVFIDAMALAFFLCLWCGLVFWGPFPAPPLQIKASFFALNTLSSFPLVKTTCINYGVLVLGDFPADGKEAMKFEATEESGNQISTAIPDSL